jgi:DNA-binding transcriptional regulator YdaS (Cro superfamily)
MMKNKYFPIELIRKQKLALLANEYGGQRKLADLIGKSEAQISQWLTGVKLPSGKERAISSETAREIEARLGLPENYMDAPSEAYFEHVIHTSWPFLEITQQDWESISERTQTAIEANAKLLIDMELERAQESMSEKPKKAA